MVTTPHPDTEDDAIAGGVLTVDLAALRHNYAWLARAAAPAACAAVVKADAYGLGAGRVAPAFYAAGCRHFFVAQLGEGLALRPHLPGDARILVLNGLQPGGEGPCAEAGLVPVLNGMAQVERWAARCIQEGCRRSAAVQVDSGMSRLGLSPDEVVGLARRPDLLGAMSVDLVMSHLACADEPDHPANAAQLAAFEELWAALRFEVPNARLSLANSGGIFLEGRFPHDLVRPGIGLYGVSPTPGRGAGLRSVMRLDARVVQVRAIATGTAVGYGATFVAPGPMRIATLAVGYADGWPRHLSHKGAAYAGHTRLPILGRVSMDSMTVDVSALVDGALGLGSLVELIGPHQGLDAVAALADTIPYEILTALGRRYARRYVDDTSPD